MVKGKGRGRGRGRAKDSADSQREQKTAEKTEPGSVKRAPNLCVNEPCRASIGNSEPSHKEHSVRQKSVAKINSLEQFSPNYNKQRNLENFSGDHEAAKAENFSHNPRKIPHTDVPCNGNYAKGIINTVGNYRPTSQSTYDVKAEAKSSNAVVCISESPRSNKSEIIERPNYGTQGRRIAVVANYFLLKGRGKDIYRYDVEIVDCRKKTTKAGTIKEAKERGATSLEVQQKRNVGKQRCREIFNQLINDKKLEKFHPFYDGQRNLFTFQPLPITGKATAYVNLFDVGCQKTYKVEIQAVNINGTGNVINLDSLNTVCDGHSMEIPWEAIMAFDMILCHRNPPFHDVGVGRSFFSFTEMRKNQLDGQVEIWKGYNQSVHLTLNGPAVVVNVANKAFHSAGFVIDHACDILGFDITSRKLSCEDIQKLSKSLSNMKVEVTHLLYPRRYTVISVTKKCAKDLIVDIGGKDMSVAQFFSAKHKRLNFPDLPCLSMKCTGKPTYTPMECCVIVPGQPKLGKLNKKQTADMISSTAIDPFERFETLENYVQTIEEISGPYMTQSGMRMELTPMNLTARIISPPALTYKNKSSVQPDSRGVWCIDGANFSKASGNAQWVLISFANKNFCPDKLLVQLSDTLVKASRNVGLNLNRPMEIKSYDGRTVTYDALCYTLKLKVDFAFVILSRNDKYHSYDEVKFIADVKLGLITQCMEDVVVQKSSGGPRSGQIINNVLSKLNIKLGGINHTFSQQPSVSMKRTIVMGADAAHSPRGSKCPSIAAVVGSVDDVPFQYAVACRVQKNPDESKISQEIILDMNEMTKHILRSYRERNGVMPEKIIFFRDGVSEGQFETVLRRELSLMQRACHEVFGKNLPVTFIVVQKRHQTRFKPKNPSDGIGKCRNVPPGTTVDTDVVHPVHFDFFICSHEGLKGTSKPAHYVVLHDDNKFQADELQKFCYELCHVYARCNRSISIPAPAMNAHLAAARAKKYVEWHILNDTSSSSGCSSDDSYFLPQHVIDFVNNISDIKAPMFFV